LQNGTVTAVSTSSITVKSTDAYSRTYTITSSTTVDQGNDQTSSVKTGDTVTVIASQAGSATSVMDRALAQSSPGQGGAPGNCNGPGGNG
jgi:hypothetical protein